MEVLLISHQHSLLVSKKYVLESIISRAHFLISLLPFMRWIVWVDAYLFCCSVQTEAYNYYSKAIRPPYGRLISLIISLRYYLSLVGINCIGDSLLMLMFSVSFNRYIKANLHSGISWVYPQSLINAKLLFWFGNFLQFRHLNLAWKHVAVVPFQQTMYR